MTDFDCSLIKNSDDIVIGKSNQTGLYRLEEGTMVEGDPGIPISKAPQDPVEFVNTLVPWLRFEYDDETHDNILSLGIEKARTLRGYTVEDKDGIRKKVTPNNGSVFLLIHVDLVNLGHKSSTNDYLASNPRISNYRVFFEGYNYTPLSVNGRILSGTYYWNSYKETSLNRYERALGALIFEVPDCVELSRTYFQADLGLRGKPMWHLV
jgi:hypothetical protein